MIDHKVMSRIVDRAKELGYIQDPVGLAFIKGWVECLADQRLLEMFGHDAFEMIRESADALGEGLDDECIPEGYYVRETPDGAELVRKSR